MTPTLSTSPMFILLYVLLAKDVVNIATNPISSLSECEGDCDNDANCVSPLLCWQRSAGEDLPPGCTGYPKYHYDYCYDPSKVLSDYGKSPSAKLDKCEGDCDSDNDCLNGLKCWQRDTGEGIPPGCGGDPKEDYDYCYSPEGRSLKSISVDPSGKLAICEGDCDYDSDCEGGLFCWQRDQGSHEGVAIPSGCYGNSLESWDYCYEPQGGYVIQSIATGPQQQLPICAGDCDNDGDCIGDLFCFHRHADEDVPGCNGAAPHHWDYCVSKHSERRFDEIFIIMTHNSLAIAGKVGSPNQNYDLARQFRDGVRGFNLDLYMVGGKVITHHGPGGQYEPESLVRGLMTELEKNPGEFIIVQLQAGEDLDMQKVYKWFGNKLVTENFNLDRKIGEYLRRGKQVVVFTDRYSNDHLGIFDTKKFITENDYGWNTEWWEWLITGWLTPIIPPIAAITGLFGSPLLELNRPPMEYRRGPKDGNRIILMNYFCCDGTGNMVKASRLHRGHTVNRNMGYYKEEAYVPNRINILNVDYYDVNNRGILKI